MEKNNNGLLIGISVLVIIVIGYFGIYPLINQIKEKRVEVSAKRAEANALEQKRDNLRTLNTQFASRADELNKLKIGLPKDAKAEEIFVMIDGLSTTSGLKLESIQPQTQTTPGGDSVASSTSSVTVNAVVSGDFTGITRFTDGLKNNIRPVSIKNVTVASQNSDTGKNRVNATFALEFLIAKAPAADTAAKTTNGEAL